LHRRAQTPRNAQAEIEKMKKRIEADKRMDPAQKAMMLQMLNSKGVRDGAQYADRHPDQMARLRQIDEGKAALPVRDTRRLASIPATPGTAVQLKQYIGGLSGKLSAAIDPGAKRHADSLMASLQGNGGSMAAMAVEDWLAGDPEGATYLAARAAAVDPVPVCLGNLGGMLNMLGHEEKAVPLLQYALKQAPHNAVLLNNMGRAWLGLGETAKAKQLFLACVGQEPFHPEANNSLGCISEAEKDVNGAIRCYEHSLGGAFNAHAYERLAKLEPQVDLEGLIAHHFKPPLYFNEFKIALPEECRDVLQEEQVRRVHEAFEAGLDDLFKQYAAEEKIEEQKAEREMKEYQQALMQTLQSGKTAAPPALPPLGKLAVQVFARQNEYFVRAGAFGRSGG
jgi:tetratricopeptide (TPR) repeat protein